MGEWVGGRGSSNMLVRILSCLHQPLPAPSRIPCLIIAICCSGSSDVLALTALGPAAWTSRPTCSLACLRAVLPAVKRAIVGWVERGLADTAWERMPRRIVLLRHGESQVRH